MSKWALPPSLQIWILYCWDLAICLHILENTLFLIYIEIIFHWSGLFKCFKPAVFRTLLPLILPFLFPHWPWVSKVLAYFKSEIETCWLWHGVPVFLFLMMQSMCMSLFLTTLLVIKFTYHMIYILLHSPVYFSKGFSYFQMKCVQFKH